MKNSFSYRTSLAVALLAVLPVACSGGSSSGSSSVLPPGAPALTTSGTNSSVVGAPNTTPTPTVQINVGLPGANSSNASTDLGNGVTQTNAATNGNTGNAASHSSVDGTITTTVNTTVNSSNDNGAGSTVTTSP